MCPSDSIVVDFLGRRLSLEQRAAVEAHVDDCASCRRLLIELSSGMQLLSAVAEAHTTLPARTAGPGEILARGTTVDRFVVLDRLGSGGMGIVYMAYDPDLDRKVALKLLHTRGEDRDQARARLLAEAQAMARISHDNVIAIYEIGTYREQVFAAMELVEGTTLRRRLAERRLRWREVVEIFLRAGDGLAAAHAAGVIHRDFKPENVLLGRDGRVKVSDFGLASFPLRAELSVAGTPGYLPVEALQPGAADERADQFSFCVALYEALHGARPFSSHALDEFVAEVRRGPPPGSNRRVPAALNQLVRRGLALAPADRHPSLRELLAAIRKLVAARQVWRRMTATAAVLAVAVVTTGIAVGRRRGEDAPPCADAQARLAGIWDPARRAAIRAAFLGTALPDALTAFDGVAAALDRYTAGWAAAHAEACAAVASRHPPAAMPELRMQCLDRARIQLALLGDALAAGGADVVRKAEHAAQGLPTLDACRDPDALLASVSRPLELAARVPVRASAAAAVDALAPDDDAVASGPIPSRPDFRLPFACGEAWQLVAPRPMTGAEQANFMLPRDAPSDGAAVFVSAPGWVSRVATDTGEVEIAHGGGWFTSYQRMTEIAVAPGQYIGRGQVIGRVGHVDGTGTPGGRSVGYLHYEQRYRARDAGKPGEPHPPRALYLEREDLHLAATGAQIRTSTNNCVAGGVPGSGAQYDIPVAARAFSPSRYTQEIMARRSEDHALFERWYDRGWRGAPMPHTLIGRPAVAVFDGELHVIGRKSDGTLFDLHYQPFHGWQTTYLEGKVSADPEVTVYGWRNRLQIAARDPDGFLDQWWTGPDGRWSRPVRLGQRRMVGTPAMWSHYDALYVVARSADGTLWSWRVDRRGWWTEWPIGGRAADSPNLGVDPRSGRVSLLARGADDRLYHWQSTASDLAEPSPDAGWSPPELVDAERRVTGTPAVIIYHGALHVFARGIDGTTHHWSHDPTWRWDAIGGAYTTSPDVYHFGDQLQTFGRNTDGHLQSIWYDAEAGIWNVESHGVPID